MISNTSKEDENKYLRIGRAVKIRHDIVHRNGRTQEGEECYIRKNDVEEIWRRVTNFIEEINKQLH